MDKNNWTYQNIRQKAFKRAVKRRIRKRKARFQSPPEREGLPVPRKIRRTVISSSVSVNGKRKNGLPKKSNYIKRFSPPNLGYLIKKEESPFYLEQIKSFNFNSNGVVKIPKIFSIIEDPELGILTLQKVISALLIENNEHFRLDYAECEKVELGSQILLDIILQDFRRLAKKSQAVDRQHRQLFPKSIGGDNIVSEAVEKMIFSVGSPVSLDIRENEYPDIIPYKLCIHDNEKEKDLDRRMEQKELDTSEMADYVLSCLRRMKKKLTSEKLDDLCTVIGEILINAEEHSSTKYRFSIGYFKEENIKDKHFGVFRLVILNFGDTIYDKFSSKDCPNPKIVAKMKKLSESYTRKNFFTKAEFEEENLWTLYALQEGVSSVSPFEYKRGNGSIRFIESFFNIKENQEVDNISSMTIWSGRTKIVFDGTYEITTKFNEDNERFRVMTFNDSGNIEDKPDNKYVYQAKHYFPGTIISAKILINDDDVEQLNNKQNGNS